MSIHVDQLEAMRDAQAAKAPEMTRPELSAYAGGMPPGSCEIMAPLETAEQVAAGTFEGQTPLEMAQAALAGMGFEMGTPTLSAAFEATGPSVSAPAAENNLTNIFSYEA
jgi:hypothetical protein